MAMVVYQGPPASTGSTALCVREPENTSANGTDGRGFVGLTLYMTPDFRRAIFSWNYDPEKDGLEEWCIPLQLQRLFGLLQLSKAQAIDTVALTHSFGWEGTEVFQQQDVQELTRVLFDALEESFRGTAVENIIDELYAGELIDYIRCLDVDYQGERRDKFLDFALAIVPFGSETPLRSLSECIEMYLRPEILDGDNQYFAEKYNRKSDAIKGLKFGRLPQIMSIQLKRFVYDWSGPTIVQKKLNDVVKFPMILDMNKYVASKRTSRRSLSKPAGEEGVEEGDGVEGEGEGGEEEVEEVNNEFETFLQKQIERLKSEREPAEDTSCGDEVTTTVSWSSASSAVPSSNRSPANCSDSNGDVGERGEKEERADVTNGKMSAIDEALADPEAAGAGGGDDAGSAGAGGAARPVERRKRADSTVEDADEGVIYESLSVEQIQGLLDSHGEWIYELYAVLIHAGAGIQYGHYYAYIKDLNSKQWWNFNDSSVTPIDERTVQEAWGAKHIPTASSYATAIHSSASSYYGGSSHYYGGSFGGVGGSSYTSTVTNNANAYMLMYRKITSTASFSASKEGEPHPLVPDELVPRYIIDAVREEEEKREAKRREEEELRNRLKIRVYWQNNEFMVPSHRQSTYQDLLKAVWEQLDLKTHLREIVPKYLRGKMLAAASDEVKPAVEIVAASEEESRRKGRNGDDGCADSTDTETALDHSGTASTASNSSITAATATLDTDDVKLDIDESDVEVLPATTAAEAAASSQAAVHQSPSLTPEQENILTALVNSGEPCYDLFRLRNYNHYTQLKTDVYSFDTCCMKMLEELQFNDYRSYIVETRSADEEWEVFYADGISLLMVEFDRQTCTFKEPRNLRMKKYSTLADLKRSVSKWVSYDAEHVRILKISNHGFNDARLDVLDRDNARLREDLSIYDGYKLYCEEIVEEEGVKEGADGAQTGYQSLVYEAYLVLRNTIDVRYNKPKEETFNNMLKVDARWTVQQLRAEIASILSLPADEVRLFKQSIRGQELKDNATSLAANGVYTGISIAISQGKAAPAGHYSIALVEYTAADFKGGAITLPDLEAEEEEVAAMNVEAIGSGVDDAEYGASEAGAHSDDQFSPANVADIVPGSSCFNPLVAQLDPLDTIDLNEEDGTGFGAAYASESAAVAAAVAADSDAYVTPIKAAAASEADIGVAPGFNIGDYDFDDPLETLSNQGVADASENLNDEDNFYAEGYDDDFFESTGGMRTDEAGFIVDDGNDGDADKYPSCTSTAGRTSPVVDDYENRSSAAGGTYLDAAALELATLSCMDTSAVYSSSTNGNAPHNVRMPEHPYAPILGASHDAPAQAAVAVAAAEAVAASSSSIPGGASVYATTAAAVDDPAVEKLSAARAFDVDVEPSAFGQLMVRNCNPLNAFKPLEGADGLFLQSTTTIEQVKHMVLEKLVAQGRLPAGSSHLRIRLRDKIGSNPGRILAGQKSFQENSVYLFDNKSFAVQILDGAEDLPEFEQGNVVVMVQQWMRSTWSLGERFEVLLRGSQTVRDIARGLSCLSGIPLDGLRVLVVPKETEFYLSELSQKSPSRNYGHSWFDPTKEFRLLRYMSHAMRVQDGDLLIIQNIDEPLMELSPADLKSIQIVEAAANSNEFIDFWAQSDAAEASSTSATTKTVKFSSQPSVGITIKTYKDRMKEGSEKNGSEGPFTSAADGAGAAAAAAAPDSSGDTVSTEMKEFQKQGGLALFEDIM